MKKVGLFVLGFAGILLVLGAQQADVIIKLEQGQRPAIAIPDLRGAGAAGPLMDPFNRVLWDDLNSSGLFKMAPKSMYPTNVPQEPTQFRTPPANPREPVRRRGRRAEPVIPPNGGGLWLTD